MREIISIKFGSHLYGTDTENSDLDIKGIYVPSGKEIILQKVQPSISTNRSKKEFEKNYANELDQEFYSLQRYLKLLSEGQTVALDILFSPPSSWLGKIENEWEIILQNRSKLLCKKSAAFVGYCRQQANVYSLKGTRVSTARVALEFLNKLLEQNPTTTRLGDFEKQITEECEKNSEFMNIITIEQVNKDPLKHWQVCGRKLSWTASIKSAKDTIQRLVDEYGARSIKAEKNEGIDWKALSHAVRVGCEAIELFNTGKITFPLPNREYILAIKQGKISYNQVSKEIEDLLVKVEEAEKKTSLPDKVDEEWINNMVLEVYKEQILSEFK